MVSVAREIFVDVRVSNPFRPGHALSIRAFVDNGSTDSALPGSLLRRLGVRPAGRESYEIWGGRVVKRRWGFVHFEIQGKVGIAKVTFEPEAETPTIGAVALEELGFDIDMKNGGLRPFLRRGPTMKRRPVTRLKAN